MENLCHTLLKTHTASLCVDGTKSSHHKHNLKSFMAFINKVIKKRITNLISRFDVPKIPPHMINQLGVEKEATSSN